MRQTLKLKKLKKNRKFFCKFKKICFMNDKLTLNKFLKC